MILGDPMRFLAEIFATNFFYDTSEPSLSGSVILPGNTHEFRTGFSLSWRVTLMNRIFRFSGLAVFAAVVLGLSATQGFAQDACTDTDAQTALYTKFTELYPKKDLESRKGAVAAGKEFLEKYGACETVKEQVDYFKTAVPALEKSVKEMEDREAMGKLFGRYDAAVNADNADEIFAAGKEILAKQPDNVNIMIPMGMVGLVKAYAKDTKYADESIRYAQMALTDLKGGKPCNRKDKTGKPTTECGVLKWQMERADIINELTYATAYLKFYAKGDKKGALPTYYELAQGTSKYKDEPRIYATIGSYYVDESAPIGKEIITLIDTQKKAATDEEKEKLETEIKGKVALLNGYTERALDAFGRAHKAAEKKGATEATLKAELYKTLQALYERRFEKKDGLDAWVAAAVAKPLPNPTSAVEPVSDPDPVKTTSTTTTAPTGTPATGASQPPAPNGKTTATTAKPAATTTAKPAATTTAKPAATTAKPAATTTKPATTAKTAKTVKPAAKTSATTKPKR